MANNPQLQATDDALDALSKLVGDPIEKAGARMKKERLERFRKAMDMLGKLLKEFVGEQGSSLHKSDGDVPIVSAHDPNYLLLVKNLESLTSAVQEQQKQISVIGKAAPASNQIPVEPRQRSQSESETAWPLDLNRPITRETVEKDVSFFEDK